MNRSHNCEILNNLFENGHIDLQPSPLFNTPPPPLPAELDFERIEGMLLGLAIGDALGNTSESLTPQKRLSLHGEIRDYLPNPRAQDQTMGLPSDDTQMAFWTLEQMIADNGFIPENVAARFCQKRIIGISDTVKEFIANYRLRQLPWWQCGAKSAGNGALMRIAPMLIPYLRNTNADIWTDTALCGMITHNDSASLSACLAFVNLLWQVLPKEGRISPSWWLETFLSISKDLERRHDYRSRSLIHLNYQGSLSQFVEENVNLAYQQELTVLEACNTWLSGSYLLETVPSVLYILMRHGNDPEEAIVRAVNDTWDNDTTAAIVGAVVGALHGKSQLPERWLKNLSGRTNTSDDEKIYQVIDQAREMWWD
jgi:ADP-ribosylglycohydrolase